MSDPRIDCWRLHGKVFLWRFAENTRNYPGWDCTADPEGCRSLLDLFTLMADAACSSKKDITITRPTEEIATRPGHRCGGEWLSPGRLRLVYPKSKVVDNLWRWDCNLQSATLTIGRSKLEALRHAFESVGAGKGDFCIHADDQNVHGFDPEKMAIWFW
jgi:hypothetical protein